MKCTQFAYDLDDGVLDVQTTTTYDPDGNVVSVVEENAINYLTEDDGADEPLVFGTDSTLEDEEEAAFEGRYLFNGLDIEVDDALQYNRVRCFDPTIGRWLNQEPLGFDASCAGPNCSRSCCRIKGV